MLLATVSGFAQLQWRPLASAPENTNGTRFDDVFFLNEQVGWAANGYGATVHKTTDGGQTWEQQVSFAGQYYLRNIEFLNEDVGFLGTLNNKFFKTVDGGANWSEVTNFPTIPAAICGLDCVGTTTVYGCGAYFTPAYVIKSVDSGQTWQYIDMSAYATALVEILFLDENLGYAAGANENGGVILKTTDGGTTWTQLYQSAQAGEYVWKLQVLESNRNVIFGSVESVAPLLGKLVRSTDNGVTWTSKEVPDSDIQAVGFVTENHGWMGGHLSGFLETNDAGETWTDTEIGSNLNRIFFINDHFAYASGSTIYKFNDTSLGNATFVEKAREPLKVVVNPNPVKDKLNVTIEFLGTDHLIIELYDIQGKRIKVLQKDNISGASKKTYTFDFPYAKGVYSLNFHTNTGRQSVKFIK